MNKANQIATGKYLLFLNSGDSFSSVNILTKIFKNSNRFEYSLIAGRTEIFYKNQDLNIVTPPRNITLDTSSESFSHQATFIHKSIYKKLSYNTSYAISSDKEYWYRVKRIDGFTIKFYDINIADFKLGGVSNNHRNTVRRRVEDLFIESKYEGVDMKKLTKMYIKTLLTFLITINEDFYFKKIYVFMNKLKNKKN